MACDIFLSYTRLKDFRGTVADFVVHLQRETQKKTGRTDLQIFLDTKYIAPGAIWTDAIKSQLEGARMLLVLYRLHGSEANGAEGSSRPS